MTQRDTPTLLHTCHGPAGADADQSPAPDPAPNSFTEYLRQIGAAAAADGQPWPERLLLPGRRLALADSDGALALSLIHI